jgi:tape measure domain-containing protein
MANENELKAQIVISGKNDASLSAATNQALGQLQKLQANFDRMSAGVQHMWQHVASGVLIAEGVEKAFEGITEGIEKALEKVQEFAKEFLAASAAFHKLQMGLGMTLGNKELGSELAERLHKQGIRGLGGAALIGSAQKLSAAGVPEENLFGTERQLQQLTLGAGGSTVQLDQLTSLYTRVLAKGNIDQRAFKQFAGLGIPLKETLEHIIGVDDAHLQAIMKKGGLSAQLFTKALAELTGKSGKFANAFDEYASTFAGAQDRISQQTEALMLDFGDVEEKALQPLLDWFSNSGIWDEAKDWFDQLREWTTGLVSYFKTANIGGKLDAAMRPVKIAWARFNEWIESFFTEFHNPATGNIDKALNASGIEKLQRLQEMLSNIVSSAGTLGDKLGKIYNAIAPIAGKIGEITKAIDDQLYGNLVPKAWSAITTTFDKITAGFQALQAWIHRIFSIIPGMPHSELEKQTMDTRTKAEDAAQTILQNLAREKTYEELIKEADERANLTSKVDLQKDSTVTLTSRVEQTSEAMQKFADRVSRMLNGQSGGYGWGTGTSYQGSMQPVTEYGRAVDFIDKNGVVHGTPDSDSSKGIGHINGRAFNLDSPGAQPTAMKAEHARKWYPGLKPGGEFKSRYDGKTYRWMDTSGAANPDNEDRYKGASNNVTVHYHLNVLDSSGVDQVLKEHGYKFAKHIERSVRDAMANSGCV